MFNARVNTKYMKLIVRSPLIAKTAPKGYYYDKWGRLRPISGYKVQGGTNVEMTTEHTTELEDESRELHEIMQSGTFHLPEAKAAPPGYYYDKHGNLVEPLLLLVNEKYLIA